MSEYCDCTQTNRSKKNTNPYSNRTLRRKAVTNITKQLEDILHNESMYFENIPENMKNGERAESASQSISNLTDALELLLEAYC